MAAASRVEHESDRFSYMEMLERIGLTETEVRELSEREHDMIDMPYPVHPYRLADSPIEGRGYFITVRAKAGDILAPSHIGDKRTPAGRYVNHSGKPNAESRIGDDGVVYLVATADIQGCMGGGVGSEVTTNYEHTLTVLARNFRSGEEPCLEQ